MAFTFNNYATNELTKSPIGEIPRSTAFSALFRPFPTIVREIPSFTVMTTIQDA